MTNRLKLALEWYSSLSACGFLLLNLAATGVNTTILLWLDIPGPVWLLECVVMGLALGYLRKPDPNRRGL